MTGGGGGGGSEDGGAEDGGADVSAGGGDVLVGSLCAKAAVLNTSTAAVAKAPISNTARLTDLLDNGSPRVPSDLRKVPQADYLAEESKVGCKCVRNLL
ncbi:hypothetical protein [Lentzea pudingi]|nr:hypothetical protein [Lentzea pudingi]